MEQTVISVEFLMKLYFEASEHGWITSESVKHKMPELPGNKVIAYEKGAFVVGDSYYTQAGPEGHSYGLTQIIYKSVPVWYMAYHGIYPKKVINFLKRALRDAYDSRLFLGGRGPYHYNEGTRMYLNHVDRELATFEHFKGSEEIRERETGELLGWHAYEGRLLFNP